MSDTLLPSPAYAKASIVSRALRIARAKRRRERGAVTPMFAVCIGLILMSMLGGIDMMRVHLMAARLQNALDVATLSASVNLSLYPTLQGSDFDAWKTNAYNYLMSNVPDNYVSGTVDPKSFQATVTGALGTGQTVSVQVNANVPMWSAGLLPILVDTVTASNSAVRRNETNLELVMGLDNTGSMGSSATGSGGATKIQGLRDAASTLVTLMLGDGSTPPAGNAVIGLVPFASTVNVKSIASSSNWFGALPSYNTNGVVESSWSGCTVEPRLTNGKPDEQNGVLDVQTYKPADKVFKKYYYNAPASGMQVQTCPSGTWQNCASNLSKPATTINSIPFTITSGGVPNPNGEPGNIYAQDKYSGLTRIWAQRSDNPNSTYTQNNNCISQKVVFLSSDQSALNTAIKGMNAAGSTIIPLGLLWGWRMLSPDWAGTTGWGSTTLPYPVDKVGLKRVLIILTDGQNQVSGTNTFPNAIYNNGLSGIGNALLNVPSVTRADGSTLSNGRIDSAELHKNSPTDSSAGGAGYVDDLNTYQLALCNKMKAEGITIYAITFGSDSSSSVAQQSMLACATDADHYFHAPDNSTLQKTFGQIAGSLSELRLVK
ncbi:Flp pilus assembly protein TadG [Paraburkholderia sp. GAS199]|uniref:TadE/TadG family type IV pilus assembly protein n=1 Tax=Paraburkholderia sp. GAS199 TaxID=3035126 RepID=UPI003D2081CA